MEKKLFSQYRFKFYLNASHSIIINGRQGEAHPHTWEMILDILVNRDEFQEFNVYEKEIEKFFSQYQDSTLNTLEPFDVIVPTLENIVDYFGDKLRILIREMGGELMRFEGSETPTRSYILSYVNENDYLYNVEKQRKESLENVIDAMLDYVLE